MIKIVVKKHIGFHYFIDRNVAAYFDFFGIEYIQLFGIEYIPQQNPNQLLTIYLEYKIMNLLRVDFFVSLCRKNFARLY